MVNTSTPPIARYGSVEIHLQSAPYETWTEAVDYKMV